MNEMDVFKAISGAAVEEYLNVSSPEWISETKAKKTYGSSLDKWESTGLVSPIKSKSGRLSYPAHRLKSLQIFYSQGKGIDEMLRMFKLCGESVAAQNGITRRVIQG